MKLKSMSTSKMISELVTPYCVFVELVFETVFKIRQLLVLNILLSLEYWKASY